MYCPKEKKIKDKVKSTRKKIFSIVHRRCKVRKMHYRNWDRRSSHRRRDACRCGRAKSHSNPGRYDREKTRLNLFCLGACVRSKRAELGAIPLGDVAKVDIVNVLKGSGNEDVAIGRVLDSCQDDFLPRKYETRVSIIILCARVRGSSKRTSSVSMRKFSRVLVSMSSENSEL